MQSVLLLLIAAMPGWQQKHADDVLDDDLDIPRKEQVCVGVGIVVMVGCRAFLQLLLLWM